MELKQAERPVRYPALMIGVLMCSTFTGLFGETALNMALTTLMHEFSVTAGAVQWLVTGYLLTLAVFMPVSAILVKWFNTRPLIVAAVLLSLLGCLVSGCAGNLAALMLGRFIQAVGTAIILPMLMSIALLIFPLHQRGKVMGMVGVAITLAPALGPTLSGFIITEFSWRAIFFISTMLYIVTLFVALYATENTGDITCPRIDVASLILSAAGFSGIIFGMGALAGMPVYSVQVWGALSVGFLSLSAFVWRQTMIPHPVINLEIFSCPAFVGGVLMMMLSIMSVLATAIILPIYFIDVLLLQAVMAGLILLPGNAINVIFSPLIGALYHRHNIRPFALIGSLCIVLSAVAFLYISHVSAPEWNIVTAFMLLCFGVTCIIMPVQTAALSSLPTPLYADGSSVWNTLYQVSGAAGTSVAITLLSCFSEQRGVGGERAPDAAALLPGVHAVFVFILILGLVSFLLSFWIAKPEPEDSPTSR